MDMYFEDDDTICINKGETKECFIRNDDTTKFDCDRINSCSLYTNKHDFHCIGGIQGHYDSCKLNDPHYGDKIGGPHLVYSCISKDDPVFPNKNHIFQCDSSRDAHSSIDKDVQKNSEKIQYIMNVLQEMPGPRQSTLTLH